MCSGFMGEKGLRGPKGAKGETGLNGYQGIKVQYNTLVLECLPF